DVHDVVVGVSAVVELRPERILPFLGLQYAVRIRGMKKKRLEIQFADPGDPGPGLQLSVGEVAHTVGSLQKANLRVEIGTDFATVVHAFKPIRLIADLTSSFRLSRADSLRTRLSCEGIDNHVPEKHQPRVGSARLVEAV